MSCRLRWFSVGGEGIGGTVNGNGGFLPLLGCDSVDVIAFFFAG